MWKAFVRRRVLPLRRAIIVTYSGRLRASIRAPRMLLKTKTIECARIPGTGTSRVLTLTLGGHFNGAHAQAASHLVIRCVPQRNMLAGERGMGQTRRGSADRYGHSFVIGSGRYNLNTCENNRRTE